MNQNVMRTGALQLVVMLMLCAWAPAMQGVATLRGQITDQLGGVIVGASVTLIAEDGKELNTETDDRGMYRFVGLRPGTYGLQAVSRGFAGYRRSGLVLTGGQAGTLDVKLTATIEDQKSTIQSDDSAGDPSNNKSAVRMKGKDLDALPDDPDALADALTALAGPAAGPSGVEISLDGFTSAAPASPDRQSIREIVINRNPFSAEYDRIGYARIDILTKPGTGKIHGGASFNFNDGALNTRNPYAPIEPSNQRRTYAANASGPLSSKVSFFLSVNSRQVDENAVINAIVLDDALNVTNLNRVGATPEDYLLLAPRVDFQLNPTNTLRVSYSYNWSKQPRAGFGGWALESKVRRQDATIHQLNLTETAVLNPRVVNESRLQYFEWERTAKADQPIGSLVVLDAFASGGASVALGSYVQHEFELHNYTTVTSGPHTFRFGGRWRAARVRDLSALKGLYVFTGRMAPEIDSQNQIVLRPDGQPKFVPITSIEAYRRTLLFQRLGQSASEIRALGGGAAQFMIPFGSPVARITQMDFGGFIQDDWRLRPGFTLSVGLRYQNQTNDHSSLNFAPRAAFAWAPGTKSTGQPRTVIRGGFGIFYDWIASAVAVNLNHFDGSNQTIFIVTDPQALDSFPSEPPSAQIQSLPHTVFTRGPDLRLPYTMQSSISIERNLPHGLVVAATYIHARGSHMLFTRNINAPLPNGVRPLGNENNIYEYETAGAYRQNLMIVNASIRPSRRVTLTASYALGFTKTDTDGEFPANSNDLHADFGRSETDLRHRFIVNGTIDMPLGISLNPFVLAQSGAPFNITTGADNNNDTVFEDRPAFATDLKRSSVVITPLGAFDFAPEPSQRIIPRNFGLSSAYVSVNMRVGRTFTLGGEDKSSAAAQRNSAAGPRTYKLTAAVDAVNIFNHANQGGFVGNLTSSVFGTSRSLLQIGQRSPSSNRNISMVVSFNF